MRRRPGGLHVALALLLAGISLTSCAETPGLVESMPMDQFWLNAGFLSYHYRTDQGLDNTNLGLGGEYRFSTVYSVTAGQFHNSDRQTSHYVGLYWQPLAWGRLRLGAVVGGFDGYPTIQNGRWFAAVIPVASLEYGDVGANLAVIPESKDLGYGVISLQLKLRLH
jgi:hypothetical protein